MLFNQGEKKTDKNVLEFVQSECKEPLFCDHSTVFEILDLVSKLKTEWNINFAPLYDHINIAIFIQPNVAFGGWSVQRTINCMAATELHLDAVQAENDEIAVFLALARKSNEIDKVGLNLDSCACFVRLPIRCLSPPRMSLLRSARAEKKCEII